MHYIHCVMITISMEKEVFQTILDALEIASSWHKSDPRFKKARISLSSQGLSL